MAYRHEILDELQTLKQDASRLLGSSPEGWREASRQRATDIAAEVKAFLSDLRDALAHEEDDIERVFAGRAATALTTALVLGVVIGWALRSKP